MPNPSRPANPDVIMDSAWGRAVADRVVRTYADPLTGNADDETVFESGLVRVTAGSGREVLFQRDPGVWEWWLHPVSQRCYQWIPPAEARCSPVVGDWRPMGPGIVLDKLPRPESAMAVWVSVTGVSTNCEPGGTVPSMGSYRLALNGEPVAWDYRDFGLPPLPNQPGLTVAMLFDLYVVGPDAVVELEWACNGGENGWQYIMPETSSVTFLAMLH